MKIESSVYVLGDNIDTDQILTAEYMKINPSSPSGYEELGALAMCGLSDKYEPFIDQETGKAKHQVIIAGDNYGCGSSREHAVMALGSSGVRAVVAKSFARIFYRNCISTGELLPIRCPSLELDKYKTGDQVVLDIDNLILTNTNSGQKLEIENFGELAAIVKAGGLFEYARQTDMF